MRRARASAEPARQPWVAIAYFTVLGVALFILCWSALVSTRSRREFDFFMEVRAGALADALARAVEYTLAADGGGAGPAAAASTSRAELLRQLERCGATDLSGLQQTASGGVPAEAGLSGIASLLSAVAGTGAISYATLFDADGRILASTSVSRPLATVSMTVNRAVPRVFDRPGVLRVGVAAQPLLAAHRLGMQRTFVVSLLVATLACLMAAIVLVRERELLREAQRDRSLMGAVLAGMGDGVVVLGAEGTVRLANPAACELFGVLETDLVGKASLATPCGELSRRLAGASAALETVIPRAGGTAIPVQATASPVRITADGPPGTALILRDLTDVGRLAREKQRNATLATFGRFAATVAHEVRNPLNAIGMGVQRLEMEDSWRQEGKEPRRLLELIRSEIERLDHILSGFLELAPHRRLEPVPGDLDALLAGMLPLLREGGDASVHISLERGGVTGAVIDADAMRQVVLNLVRNAREALGADGHIAITTRREAGTGVLEIRDDGPGIPCENREHVFEFGFTTKPTGNGLGLPIVHRLVSEMGGSVEIVAGTGDGTAIQVRLPLADGRGTVEGKHPWCVEQS